MTHTRSRIRPSRRNSRHHQIIKQRSKPNHCLQAIDQNKAICLIHETFLLAYLFYLAFLAL